MQPKPNQTTPNQGKTRCNKAKQGQCIQRQSICTKGGPKMRPIFWPQNWPRTWVQPLWLDPGPWPVWGPENGTHFGHTFEPELGPRRALGLCPLKAAVTAAARVNIQGAKGAGAQNVSKNMNITFTWLALPWLGLAWLGLACVCLGLACLALACLALPCFGLAWLAFPWLGLACLALPYLGLACLASLCLRGLRQRQKETGTATGKR